MKFKYKNEYADTSKMNERFKQIMKSEGIVTREIAQILDCTVQQVNYLKNGDRAFTLDMTCKLCSHFNINIEWFITGIGKIYN